MLQTLSSPSRRWAASGLLIAFGALIVLAFGRSDGSSAAAVAPPRGNVSACAALKGDPARECYAREVGRELAVMSGGTPSVLAATANTTVTFDGTDTTSAALLCELHLRVGATDAEKAAWTTWIAQ
ncbi:hypothetical protein OJ998_28630 [Solirubrobacter taibaiensis]|nr:hypothetical protein [Solirubrobacter taibaiensis]